MQESGRWRVVGTRAAEPARSKLGDGHSVRGRRDARTQRYCYRPAPVTCRVVK